MQSELNEKPSILRLKDKLVSEIPYVPKSAEAKQYLLMHDIGVLLHIYHFWRQRFLKPEPRKFSAPSRVRNEPLYIQNKEKINALRQKIVAGEDVSAYLSRRAHEKALDVDSWRESRSFNSSRDQMLICDGFYHLHLAPLPERTDEILVAKVEPKIFDVIGLFTHDLFLQDKINPAYSKYHEAVESYLARKMPSGGYLFGGAGGGIQNLAGSSIASSFWQIHCMKILQQAEAWQNGIDGFTINLYNQILDRNPRYVNPTWVVADDWRLLLRDRKNKHDFWMDINGNWKDQPF